MISFPCPQCGQSLEIPDQFAGKTEVCSHCGELIAVPLVTESAGELAALADEPAPSPFAGLKDRRTGDLWSNYGRDALFLSLVSLLLLASACIVPVLGVFLAGIVGLFTMLVAIWAMIQAGSRSSRGLAYAIIALVISLVPISLACISLVGLVLSSLR